jgi:hypothetical protein
MPRNNYSVSWSHKTTVYTSYSSRLSTTVSLTSTHPKPALSTRKATTSLEWHISGGGITTIFFLCKSRIIQSFQSKLLRAITNAPWYITNAMIHSDLGILPVQDVIHDRSNKHRTKLQSHPNPLLQSLSRDNIPRRLKRSWPTDL